MPEVYNFPQFTAPPRVRRRKERPDWAALLGDILASGTALYASGKQGETARKIAEINRQATLDAIRAQGEETRALYTLGEADREAQRALVAQQADELRAGNELTRKTVEQMEKAIIDRLNQERFGRGEELLEAKKTLATQGVDLGFAEREAAASGFGAVTADQLTRIATELPTTFGGGSAVGTELAEKTADDLIRIVNAGGDYLEQNAALDALGEMTGIIRTEIGGFSLPFGLGGDARLNALNKRITDVITSPRAIEIRKGAARFAVEPLRIKQETAAPFSAAKQELFREIYPDVPDVQIPDRSGLGPTSYRGSLPAPAPSAPTGPPVVSPSPAPIRYSPPLPAPARFGPTSVNPPRPSGPFLPQLPSTAPAPADLDAFLRGQNIPAPPSSPTTSEVHTPIREDQSSDAIRSLSQALALRRLEELGLVA